jgi:hypothetical protein
VTAEIFGSPFSDHQGILMSTAASTVTTLRSTLAHRRAVRREQLQLERELASYDTPADLRDLQAILERHTADEKAPIERILYSQSLARRIA